MKTKTTKLMAAVLLFAVVWVAADCKKPEKINAPMVTLIKDSIIVSHNKVRLLAEVVDAGNAVITQSGFCYGQAGASLDTLMCNIVNGRFSVEVNHLSPSTTYVCKAFARNVKCIGYSDEFTFTTNYSHPVVVSTFEATDIATNSAVVGGYVTSEAGIEIVERGVCYSTDSDVSMSDAHIACGSGVGEFSVTLEGLAPNAVYYYCAYAVVPEGVVYGQKFTFMSLVEPMEVQTVAISDVVSTRAYCEGIVVRDGDLEVTERGFCWGTEPQPTIDGLCVRQGSGTGTYKGYISGLQYGATYHVRAYAINEKGVAYGNDLEFAPASPTVSYPNGALPGLFSISEEQQVRFSKGNLQYRPYFDQWRFAECQWDFVGGETYWGDSPYGSAAVIDGELCFGVYWEEPNTMGTVYENGVKCENQLVGYNYNGWIDLFGWGTSGWNNGNQYYKPWNYMANDVYNPYYGPYGNYDLTGEYARSDWGVHAHIPDGGSRQWRTLTKEEFEYLFDERTTVSGIRYAKAIVAGVCGLVLLPDDWSAASYPLHAPNSWASYLSNKITATEWIEVLEPAGAVFLPAAGERFSSYSYESGMYLKYYSNSPCSVATDLVDCIGNYWTASQGIGMNTASALIIQNYSNPRISIEAGRSYGKSVRLVTVE